MNKKMAEKKSNPILSYYESLASEPRGTMGKFIRWIGFRTSMMDSTVRVRMQQDNWSPAEREAIEAGIKDESWRNM